MANHTHTLVLGTSKRGNSQTANYIKQGSGAKTSVICVIHKQ